MRVHNASSLQMIPGRGVNRISGRIPRYLHKLSRSPGWLPMYVLGRLMPARRAHWLTARAVTSSPACSTIFSGVRCESVVEGLIRDGLFSGINLPSDICAEIVSFAENNSCFPGSNSRPRISASRPRLRRGAFSKSHCLRKLC